MLQGLLAFTCTSFGFFILTNTSEIFIHTIFQESSRLLVLGDFNIHAEAEVSGPALEFLETMASLDTSQHGNGPTLMGGHTLDLAFSKEQLKKYVVVLWILYAADFIPVLQVPLLMAWLIVLLSFRLSTKTKDLPSILIIKLACR